MAPMSTSPTAAASRRFASASACAACWRPEAHVVRATGSQRAQARKRSSARRHSPATPSRRQAATHGPFAYRQGKPMRPDVARAFDRMQSAARGDGIQLIDRFGVSLRRRAGAAVRAPSGPPLGCSARQVAAPSRHRARPRSAVRIRWLSRNAGRFHFLQRYSWEPWHYGYTLNPRSTPDRRAAPGGPVTAAAPCRRSSRPRYRAPIARAASRWNVSAALLAAQLYA